MPMRAQANMLYFVLLDETHAARAASKSTQAASGRLHAGPLTRSAAAGNTMKEQ